MELLERVLARYPRGNQGDRALVYLATIAGWDRDWKTAKGYFEALVRQYPGSEYGKYVKGVALPKLEQHLAGEAKAARARKVKG